MANAGNAVPATADAGDGGAATAPRARHLEHHAQGAIHPTRRADRPGRGTGDTATIINFTPMALGAYANLPPGDRDIDARFHAAMLQLRAGMFDNARALADTIMQRIARQPVRLLRPRHRRRRRRRLPRQARAAQRVSARTTTPK